MAGSLFGAVVLMVFFFSPPSPGPHCPHGPRAGGSPGPGSGVGRELSPGRICATSTWMGPHASDPPKWGFLTQFWLILAAGERGAVLSTLWVPPWCGYGIPGLPLEPRGADTPHPPIFMLFAQILINASFIYSYLFSLFWFLSPLRVAGSYGAVPTPLRLPHAPVLQEQPPSALLQPNYT